MRVLTFTEAQKDEFALLFTALNGSEKKLQAAEFRTLVKILDKVDSISVPGETPSHPREVLVNEVVAAQNLLLEDAEFSLVKALVNETSWTVRAARGITKLYDMLDNAPEPAKEAKPTLVE